MFIITYTTYHTYKDREVYPTKEEAQKRFETLAKQKAVSKLQMKERA